MFQERELGQRLNIIIVAEGAIDMDGNKITCDMIKDVSIATKDNRSCYDPLL